MIKVAGRRLTCADVADGFRAKILRSLNVAAFKGACSRVGEGKVMEAFLRIVAENASFPNLGRRFRTRDVVVTTACGRLLRNRIRSLQSRKVSAV